MLLKPFNQNDIGINSILVNAGLVKGPRSVEDGEEKKSPRELVNAILDSNGATADAAASALADALQDEGQRLKAAELVFKLNGFLKETEKPTAPSVTINILGGEGKVALLDLVSP